MKGLEWANVKPGDKLWIRDDIQPGENCGGLEMLKGGMSTSLIGHKVTVRKFRGRYADVEIYYEAYHYTWYISTEMVDWEKTFGKDRKDRKDRKEDSLVRNLQTVLLPSDLTDEERDLCKRIYRHLYPDKEVMFL